MIAERLALLNYNLVTERNINDINDININMYINMNDYLQYT